MSSSNRGLQLFLPYSYDDANLAREALFRARDEQKVQFNFTAYEGGTIIVGFDDPPNETANGHAVQCICEEESPGCCYIPVQAALNLSSHGDFDPGMEHFAESVGLMLKSLTSTASRQGFVLGQYWAIADRIEQNVVLEVGFGGQRLIGDVAERAQSLCLQLEIPFDLHYRGRTVEVETDYTPSDIAQLIEYAISGDLLRELAAGAAAVLLEISMLGDGPLPEEFGFYQQHTPGDSTNPYEEGLVFRMGGFTVARAIFRPKDNEEEQGDPAPHSSTPEGDPPSQSQAPQPQVEG